MVGNQDRSNEGRIMLRRPDGEWHQPSVGTYDNERALQDLLLESPSLLPGIHEAAVIDEMGLPNTGSVDLVLVEPSGDITLVECKLVANPEIRRAVIGQIMAYAASLWGFSYDDLDARFQRRLGVSLPEAVAARHANDEQWDSGEFRQRVSHNLIAGRFRLIIAVDRITEELKRSVEYINLHSSGGLELLAFELGYVADEGVEILIPQLHGEESSRIQGGTQSTGSGSVWSVDDVFETIATTSTEEEAEAARRIAKVATRRGGRLRTGRGQYPTLSGDIPFEAGTRALFAIYADPSGPTAPRISINFGSLRSILTTEELESLLTALESIDSLARPLAGVRSAEFNIYPAIPMSTLANPAVLDSFLEALGPWLPHPIESP